MAKSKLHMTLRDSKDEVIPHTLPDIRSRRKWSASLTVMEAEAGLVIRDIVGATQLDCRGIGHKEMVWWAQANDKQKKELVACELRKEEEQARMAVAVGQGQQGAWTRWETLKERKFSWSELWR